jgi:hypothetical protein
LLLAAVELFHPHPHDPLDLDVQTWLAVHYAQIVLFPLGAGPGDARALRTRRGHLSGGDVCLRDQLYLVRRRLAW